MPIYIRVIAVLGILCLYFHTAHLNNLNCHISEIFLDANTFQLCDNNDNINIQEKKTSNENITYILYDVNPVEGFNLRRDCFIRLAVFVKKLKKEPGYENTKLVLPPFSDLYHWRSRHLDQSHIFWNTFFNLESMKRYTDVLDMWEFFNEIQSIHRGVKKLNSITIDEVYKLKHFQEMFKNGVFEDKFEKTRCGMAEGGAQDGFFHYRNITSKRFTCVNFQGSANLLKDLLEKFKPK